MSETDLSRAIRDALEARGCMVERVIVGIHRGRKGGYMHGASDGTPDRVVLAPDGTTHWIEVKLPGKELEPSQVQWHARAKRLRQRVHVVTSVQEALAAVEHGSTQGAAGAGASGTSEEGDLQKSPRPQLPTEGGERA